MPQSLEQSDPLCATVIGLLWTKIFFWFDFLHFLSTLWIFCLFDILHFFWAHFVRVTTTDECRSLSVISPQFSLCITVYMWSVESWWTLCQGFGTWNVCTHCEQRKFSRSLPGATFVVFGLATGSGGVTGPLLPCPLAPLPLYLATHAPCQLK